MDESPGAVIHQIWPFGDGAGEGRETQRVVMQAARASAAERVWSAVNRNPGWTLATLVAFYLGIACVQASAKLLWCDELITLAVARQGSLAGIWSALAAGADPNPPLSHWLVLQSIRAFGVAALAVRLPAILCVLLAFVSLWEILRRWVPPGYAALGVLGFMATRGFDYAYDARSYAPLLGFSMASLALWLVTCDFAVSGRRWPPQSGARLAALTAMAASLALAIASSYYGVLAFFPIALGELIRVVRMRRLEAGTWLAMIAGGLPLLWFLPLIRRNLAEFGPHAWNRAHPGMIADSYLQLVEGVFWPVLGLALFAVWMHWKGIGPAIAVGTPLQPHEAGALAVLLLYPLLGFAVAVTGHGMISPRCVLPVCCGFGMAAALLGWRVFGPSPRAGAVLLCIALLWVGVRESACGLVLARQRRAFLGIRDQVAQRSPSGPVVIADSLVVLPLAFYSAEDVRRRIVFPIDFEAIHRYEADDSGEQNLWAGRFGVFPIRIVAYDASGFGNGEFTVVARPGGWLGRRLGADGFRLQQLEPDAAWQQLGGVFTPMDHEDTRLLRAMR
jgi:hypothetical protein